MSNRSVPSPDNSTVAAPPATALPAFKSAQASALLLLLVMLGGLWQLFRAGTQLNNIPVQREDILLGHSAKALEAQFNQHLPWREALIASANGTRYLLLHGGNAQVQVGRGGWLFLSEEIQPHANAQANLQARVDLIAQTRQKLAKDGVQLLVLLVPDKVRLYPQYAPQRYYDSARYPQALGLMAAQNIRVVDPLPALQASKPDTWYHSDTHWNQVGAQIVAQQVAASVKQLGLNLPRTDFALRSNSAPEQERPGDLLRLLGLEHSPNWLRPPPDRESPVKVEQTSADAASSLLDDVALPVVLTGTSYSLRAQFSGYLQHALQAKVLNAAKDGAGFWQATRSYLADPAYQTAKPMLLIWEIPERFLTAPLVEEKKP